MEKIPSQQQTRVKRIVLFGPESTGKTTLAKQLSEKYDVPWVADDLRDKPYERERMYEAFRSALEANGCNYISLQGNQTTRLESASAAIEALFQTL